MGSSRGQVALVLILIAAVGLVLYAVLLRYGTVSQTKVRTMIGAQKASAAMASYMASYAQRLSAEYLKGRLEYCRSTSLLKRILMVVLMIVAIVISVYCPALGGVWGPVFTAAVVGLAFAALAMVLDMVIIQPGITSMWNKMMSRLSSEGFTIEMGIQNAFMAAVNDNIEFPDLLDLASSGVFATVGDWEASTISRFSFYYTERLREISFDGDPAVDEFARQLRRFMDVTVNPDGVVWGLHDPLNYRPCDESFEFPLSGHNLRDECDFNLMHEEDGGTCTGSGCFYDPFFERTGNTFFSFRENVGRDAEVPYGVYRTDPPGRAYDYRVKDMSGYYQADPRKRFDGRPAIYLPLYMMDDIGVDLTLLRNLDQDYRYHCYWRHNGCVTPYSSNDPDAAIRNPLIPQLEPLVLPRLDNDALMFSGGLSGRHMGFPNTRHDDLMDADPLSLSYPDLIAPPDLFFLENKTECGHLPTGEALLKWKRGIDRYCSYEYPYHVECQKHLHLNGCTEPSEHGGPALPTDCACYDVFVTSRKFFPEDFLDDLFYGISEFLSWADAFLYLYDKDYGAALNNTFETWYDEEAADWFEYACSGSCEEGSTGCCPGSFTKRERQGYLRVLGEQIRDFHDILEFWLADEISYAGDKAWGGLSGDGYAAWCVPPVPAAGAAAAPGVNYDSWTARVETTNSEIATFEFEGIRGNMQAIFNCADWNMFDETSFLNKSMETISSQGNEQKFAACRDHCSIRACSRIENYAESWTTDHYGKSATPSVHSRFEPFLPRTTVTFPGSGGSYPGLASYYFDAYDREWFIECNFAAQGIGGMLPELPNAWDHCNRMCAEAPIDKYQSDFGGAPPTGVEEFRDMFFCQYQLDHPNACYLKPDSIAMNCYDATNVTECLTWCPRLNNCNYNFRLTLSDWDGPRALYYPEFCQNRYAEPVESSTVCGSLDDCGTCDHLEWAAEPDPEGLPLPIPVFTPTGMPMEEYGFVFVEAEKFDTQNNASVRAWHITLPSITPNVSPDPDPSHVSGAMALSYVEVLPDTRVTQDDPLINGENFTETPGQVAVLNYRIYFNNPGRYYVWTRAYSTGTEDNSIHVGLNGAWPASGMRMQWCSKDAWRWSNKQRTAANHCGEPNLIYLDIPSIGEHNITFSMREDGFELDAFMLVRDSLYVPQGAEPVYYAETEEMQACLDEVSACQDAIYTCMSDHEEAEAAKAEAVEEFMALLKEEADDDRFLRNQTRHFFDGVEVLKDTAETLSCDPGSNYYSSIVSAMNAALNHFAKMEHRRRFINTLRPELEAVMEIFGEAADRFTEFLGNETPFIRAPAGSQDVLGANYIDPERVRVVRWWDDGHYSEGTGSGNVYLEAGEGVFSPHGVDTPAELLIAERFTKEAFPEEKRETASVGIYVWRGDDMREDSPRTINGNPTDMGYVHAVKVEVRAPTRCNERCSFDGTSAAGWPTVRTKSKRWGTKRCYSLRYFTGRTKARVIRYDEPMDSSKPLFTFANNVPIRGLRTSHPDLPDGDAAAIQNVFNVCAGQIHPYIHGVGDRYASESPDNPQYLKHAFMLNYVPDPNIDDRVDSSYMRCWDYVHRNLLEKGTHSESCAQYFWHTDGMTVRFAPCDQAFSSGQF
jgi:hypothetical protein